MIPKENNPTRPSRPIGATCGSSNECVTDRQTDRPTDRPTDTASYRGALSHLKRLLVQNVNNFPQNAQGRGRTRCETRVVLSETKCARMSNLKQSVQQWASYTVKSHSKGFQGTNESSLLSVEFGHIAHIGKTNNVGSQYHCGWVDRGMQPPFILSRTSCSLTHSNIHTCIIINAHCNMFYMSLTNVPTYRQSIL